MDRAHSLVGFNPTDRPKDDFYPTPEIAIISLLDIFKPSGDIWECACGNGAISEVLIRNGYRVISTDLYEHGYGESGIDFLNTKERLSYNIITNPPFNLANEFIDHAMNKLKIKNMALLLKLQALEGDKRSKLLQQTHLSSVNVFRKRLTLTRNGEKMKNSGMIAFAWFIWKEDYLGSPIIRWI